MSGEDSWHLEGQFYISCLLIMGINESFLVLNSHSLVRLHRKKMMVTPRQMRRTDNHQAADVTVGWDVAHFREASRTEEALAL